MDEPRSKHLRFEPKRVSAEQLLTCWPKVFTSHIGPWYDETVACAELTTVALMYPGASYCLLSVDRMRSAAVRYWGACPQPLAEDPTQIGLAILGDSYTR